LVTAVGQGLAGHQLVFSPVGGMCGTMPSRAPADNGIRLVCPWPPMVIKPVPFAARKKVNRIKPSVTTALIQKKPLRRNPLCGARVRFVPTAFSRGL
jgi:hypothetical protein